MVVESRWACSTSTPGVGRSELSKRGQRRKKATCDKESQRGLDPLSAAEQGIDESVCVVHVGDPEADQDLRRAALN